MLGIALLYARQGLLLRPKAELVRLVQQYADGKLARARTGDDGMETGGRGGEGGRQ